MTTTTPALDPATTPEVTRAHRRSVRGWAAIALALVIVGVVGALLAGSAQWSQRTILDPESAGPSGTRALARILSDHGVEVVVARDRDAALSALAGSDATLVVADTPLLEDQTLTTMTDAAADVVLIDPRARTLRLLLSGSAPGGVASQDVLTPSCDLAVAVGAGDIDAGAVFVPGDDVDGCYPSGDAFGLLVDGSVAAVDGTALFTNAHLASRGNAALGIALMGRHTTLVWYLPSASDTDQAGGSLGEQTPDWVAPCMVLLLLSGVAAAIWRGRRFGPLVAERLPVTVRASETMEGRARLYARSHDCLHAADQLRIGALGRLARLLGVGQAASAIQIADAAADRVGAERGGVRGILIDDIPRTDTELVALSDRLRDLETAVRDAVRPERNPT